MGLVVVVVVEGEEPDLEIWERGAGGGEEQLVHGHLYLRARAGGALRVGFGVGGRCHRGRLGIWRSRLIGCMSSISSIGDRDRDTWHSLLK